MNQYKGREKFSRTWIKKECYLGSESNRVECHLMWIPSGRRKKVTWFLLKPNCHNFNSRKWVTCRFRSANKHVYGCTILVYFIFIFVSNNCGNEMLQYQPCERLAISGGLNAIAFRWLLVATFTVTINY